MTERARFQTSTEPEEHQRRTVLDTLLTVSEAVQRLDPPISRQSLTALVANAGLEPVAHTRIRRTSRRGRPAALYHSSDLDRLHAAWVRGDLTTRPK